MNEIACPIWATPAKAIPTTRDGCDVDSTRAAGRYFISRTAAQTLKSWDERKKVVLTAWLVEQRRLGVHCPEILSINLENLENRSAPFVLDRADALLRYIALKSEFLGDVVKFFALDNSSSPVIANELLAWTSSRKIEELITLAEYCESQKFIERRVQERAGTSQNTIHQLMLRPPGYARLAVLDGINAGSKRAFVAMWFDESMNEAYRCGIQPAIQDAGYEAVRIDRIDHNNKIDDRIIAEIRRSRFVVADFTQGNQGARGGVYYEAGFAHGLNIPVIFTCRADIIDKVHFDTRQYNHIAWKSSEDLRERLSKRISATLGDGPLRRSA
jgi:hypothetical protein